VVRGLWPLYLGWKGRRKWIKNSRPTFVQPARAPPETILLPLVLAILISNDFQLFP
jgi:hypothetical protein